MVTAKKIRQKGKIRLSEYFKELKIGDRVAIIEEKSVVHSYPRRLQGRSGVIQADRGAYKIVQINDGNKTKECIIHPVHLKKI